MFELVFLTGVRAGASVPVSNSLTAGRDAECSLEVPDPRVSRLHARFEWDGTRCRLVDAGSSNGTWVNDSRVEQHDIRVGDVIRLGSTRLLVQAGSRRSATAAHTKHSIFELQDARTAEMSHSVAMRDLGARAKDRDTSVLELRLQSMIAVSELLATVRDLDRLSEPVLDILFKLLPQTDRAFLMLGDGFETLEPSAMRQRGEAGPGPGQVSRSIVRAALERKSAILYREGKDTPIDPSMSMIDLEIRSAIAVPLSVGDEVVGMVVVDTRDGRRAYGERDLQVAAAACHQVAVAIKNAQLIREVEQQTLTRNNLMRFLPQAMADQVVAGEIDAGLGGRTHRGAFLFSDIVGFTKRAEMTEPEHLVQLLNRYFEAVVPWIEVGNGSIDKFMGDAILAVWGIPIETDDANARAVAAALSMHTSLAALNSHQEQPLHMGIGINTGEVVAGNIGTEHRLEYTVLGDAVNIAQRLGAAACVEQTVVSDATWHALGGAARGVALPPLLAKGKSEPLICYSVRGLVVADEMQTFVPVRCAGRPAWLVRRLADHSFVLLHEQAEIGEVELALVECAPRPLGHIEHRQELPSEAGDGTLRRSRVVLADPDLGGLLAEQPTTAERDWAAMDRNETAAARD